MGAPWYKQTKNYKLERKVKTHKGLAIPFFIIGPLLMVGSFVFILYLLNETNIKMYEFERIGEVVKSHIPVLYVILAGFLLLIFAIINAGIRKSTDKKMRHYYPERGNRGNTCRRVPGSHPARRGRPFLPGCPDRPSFCR